MNKISQSDAIFKFIFLVYQKILAPYNKSFSNMLSPLQFYTICVIQFCGEITMTSLSNIMKMPKQNMTKIVDKLIEIGFVHRVKDKSDKRRTNISVTSEGNQFLIDIAKTNSINISKSLESLGDDKYIKFYESINTLNDLLMCIKSTE